MEATRTPFVGGNWKMNTDRETAVVLAEAVRGAVEEEGLVRFLDVAMFPPFPYLIPVGETIRASGILLGAQDVYHEPEGAYTGEVGPPMLVDCGVDVVLAGHSERRHVIGEDDELVNRKLRAGLDAGLWGVLCVGETLEEREAEETEAVNLGQLRAGLEGVPTEQMRQVVIAYEPVWAIGTGRTATPEDAQAVHAALRAEVRALYDEPIARGVRIIYGGSVKPDNAAELFGGEDVDGGLIGGASLDAASFLEIVRAAAGRAD